MRFVFFANLLATCLAAILPNDFLMLHSYALYGFQFATLLPYLLRKAVFLKNLFLPTFFVLVYFLVNLTFGSYLVPREYGLYKAFADVAANIEYYNLIVSFFMSANIVLFLLTDATLKELARTGYAREAPQAPAKMEGSASFAKLVFYACSFLAVSYYPLYSAFSFQLALLILYFTDPSLRGRKYRYGVYLFCLAVLVGLSYQNKREIAMILFLIVFLETYEARSKIKFTIGSVATYAVVGVLFFGLILAASILRGYGGYQIVSIVDAFRFIPQYMTSEIFIDGVTDNLELNYSYGVAITAVDYTLRGVIDYQYGASLIKVLFLPIPRDVIGFKPESTMQIFTQVYSYELWMQEGSFPVMSASEAFMNFNFFGLLPFALVWWGINKLFVMFHTARTRSFVACSCVFLCITVLMFARGSGIEQWVLYYLVGAPVLLLLKLFGNNLATVVSDERRWVV